MILARLFWAAVLAALAATAVFSLEVGLLFLISELFDTRLTPRGAGWLLLPLAAGIGGWKTGWNYELLRDIISVGGKITLETKIGRAILVSLLGWFVMWTAYANISEDFCRCYRWSDDDWLNYIGGLIGVPIFGALCFMLYKWIGRGK